MSGSEERTLLDLNLRRETWCQVEMDPRQAWDRTARKHYRKHLRTSPVLLAAMTDGPQRGAARTEQPLPVQRPERRHFAESCKSHLV
ncbi:spermatogenesis-associated protein 45-like isoform X2 [Melanotaenia boesemani]|uniref:spermatogenesis-associated protein 45-like isoform X2 n=1 Tax=Melanotaenia boesemani TaxID=1250792 RepID=UPI001C0422D2|nr:spermatogenesis-associated protein 45-like isoform X2 [Melanotaenia boesemani]